MAGNDRTSLFSSRKKDVKLTEVARIGCTPYTAHAYGQTCVRTLPYGYAVVNSTTRNWAHLTSTHPPKSSKKGEGDYGRIPKGLCPLFDFGEEGRPSNDFPYFPYLFNHRFLVSNCSKFCVKMDGIHCIAHERKRNHYLLLLSLCQSNGWNATHFPVEVGSRGFVAYSLMRRLRQLGFPSCWAKKVRNEASKVSLRCSYLLYLKRNIRVWQERLGD